MLTFGLASFAMIIYFAHQAGKKNRKPNLNKITIITSIVYALLIGVGILVSAIFDPMTNRL